MQCRQEALQTLVVVALLVVVVIAVSTGSVTDLVVVVVLLVVVVIAVSPGSVTDFSSSNVTSSSSDSRVAYDSDGEPAMVVNRIAEVGLREAYKYKPTLTDSGAGRGARIRQYWSR